MRNDLKLKMAIEICILEFSKTFNVIKNLSSETIGSLSVVIIEIGRSQQNSIYICNPLL